MFRGSTELEFQGLRFLASLMTSLSYHFNFGQIIEEMDTYIQKMFKLVWRWSVINLCVKKYKIASVWSVRCNENIFSRF